MCGRINLRMSPVELAEFFDLFCEPEWVPRFNLGPTQRVLVVRQKQENIRLAEPLQWGLIPSWSKDESVGSHMINARSDTISTKPAFRDSIRKRRCLVPVSGYYEWQQINSKTKQPWHIFQSNLQPLVLAGIWDSWTSPSGLKIESVAIITTDANEFISEIHTRMPVFLPKEAWNIWLGDSEIETSLLAELLRPSACSTLEKNAVSGFVNNVRNDSAECIRPVKPLPTLF